MERWALGDIQELAALTKVVVLTAARAWRLRLWPCRLGARAVVQKRFAVQKLVEAIRAVAERICVDAPGAAGGSSVSMEFVSIQIVDQVAKNRDRALCRQRPSQRSEIRSAPRNY